jgi:anti-sigma factor RsiW
MSCEHRDDVGAWVLGALDEAEQERFAAHLRGCEICQREVTELQMVADTLPLAAAQVAPPPELKERIMAAVRAEAAVLEAAGPEADVPPALAPEPVAEPAAGRPAKAPRKQRDRGWLRRPLLALRPLPAAVAAAVLIALGVGGGLLLSGGPSERTAPDPTNALFSVRGGSATVEVPGSVRGVEQVLVTDEPNGGSRAPTRAPVIIAQPA